MIADSLMLHARYGLDIALHDHDFSPSYNVRGLVIITEYFTEFNTIRYNRFYVQIAIRGTIVPYGYDYSVYGYDTFLSHRYKLTICGLAFEHWRNIIFRVKIWRFIPTSLR